MTLTLMCGLSFSGKSTLARGLAEELDAHLVSLDAINHERGLRGGEGIPLDEWATTNGIAHERAGALLAARREVVVDDTGSPRFIRNEWRETAKRADMPLLIVWVQIDPDLQRERVRANRADGHRDDVTDAVLTDHAAHFEPPTEDERPILVDVRETTDPVRIRAIAAAIRAA
ncbi:AAA family ATPase [Planctomonas deserti]|uniref:AAA family ATPase n=1 Tax=Planctomonas deserti TaxID=2144185 RepID=UPI00197B3CC9|nr:ATP-binding protein [Planctomonas deserti]